MQVFGELHYNMENWLMETVPHSASSRYMRVKRAMTDVLKLAELLQREVVLGLVTFSVKVTKENNIYVYVLHAASPSFRGRMEHVRAVITNDAAGDCSDAHVQVIHMPVIKRGSVQFENCRKHRKNVTLTKMTTASIKLLKSVHTAGVPALHASVSVVATGEGVLNAVPSATTCVSDTRMQSWASVRTLLMWPRPCWN